jgi:hypothetical protein
MSLPTEEEWRALLSRVGAGDMKALDILLEIEAWMLEQRGENFAKAMLRRGYHQAHQTEDLESRQRARGTLGRLGFDPDAMDDPSRMTNAEAHAVLETAAEAEKS